MPPPKDPAKYILWLKRNRESHKGQIPWMKGRKHTVEALLQQRIAKLGNTYRVGKRHTEEANQKNRDKHLGNIPWMKGRKHTSESKIKNSLAHIGNTNRRGQTHRPESIIKIKEARSRQIMPMTDTKIERIMQIGLTLNGIEFKKHKMIQADGFFHQVDIFIEPNICIEVDGEYWHTLPYMIERDNEVNENLTRLGYKVHRFWGKEVKNNVQTIIENLELA